MKKKTSYKKGGNSFLNKITGEKEGPLIVDNIYNEYLRDKGEYIKEKYKNKLVVLDDENKIATSNQKRDDDNRHEREDRNIEQNKLRQRWIIFYASSIGRTVLNTANYLGSSFWAVLKSGSSGVSSGIGEFFKILTKHRGPALVLIVFIVAILFLGIILLAIFGNKDADKGKFDYNASSFSNSIIQNTKPSNLFDATINKTFDMIPDKYRVQLTSLRNTFNRTIGNDTIGKSANNIIRETITTGRNDGIYHIKYDINDDKTYSILKPSNLEFSVNSRDYPNIDLYKLPAKIQELYNYGISIEPTEDENGKYVYIAENAKYKDYIKDSSLNNKSVEYEINPFKTDNNFLNIIKHPINSPGYSFNINDNVNPEIFKEKLLNNKDNIYTYQEDYIKKKIK